MKINKLHLFSLLVPALVMAVSCSDDDDDQTDTAVLQTEVLQNISGNVIEDSYQDMYDKAVALKTAVATLTATPIDANLTAAQTAWRNIRQTWERTEAWLFGPIAAEEIDPRIDTWPVNFVDLDGILANGDALTPAYIDGLEESLKGFHPIEYLLWGKNGNKKSADLTNREKEYLTALVENLTSLSEEVKDAWEGGYTQQLANAGPGSSAYPNQQAAFLEIEEAMAGICDEVANGKILDPYESGDPSQEESPFAQNSFTDFKNNITGVLLIYQGKFNADGKGLEDLVRTYNLSLDGDIKAKHQAAIQALESFGTVPFGEAIDSRPNDVENAMAKINELQAVLETGLKPFIQQFIK